MIYKVKVIYGKDSYISDVMAGNPDDLREEITRSLKNQIVMSIPMKTGFMFLPPEMLQNSIIMIIEQKGNLNGL